MSVLRGLSVLLLVLHVGALTAPRVGVSREILCADAARLVDAACGSSDRDPIGFGAEDRGIDSDDDSGLDAALPASVPSWQHTDDAGSVAAPEPASLVSSLFVRSPLHVPRV